MAKAYMIHGFIGSGKTTFARALEKESFAIRFSPDEWVTLLYGNNPTEVELRGYEARIMELIWDLVIRLVKKNIDVILDFGFWKRTNRELSRRQLEEAGASVVLYELKCSADTMNERALKRTDKGDKNALHIDKKAIEALWQRFEPLHPDEDRIVIFTD